MLDPNYSSKPFLGVSFVLFGFDPVTGSQVRTKLLNGGGVDAGLYSQICSHVIVDKIVHDDPLCITARNDGKTVVTGLWVDHSYDTGMAVDNASIMYRPPRDLNGIPGANNLIVCLTGYQRQDRDDIMTLVSLMGARFSKPLIANKVTHLICYKFEGEKYELAYKLKKIKLVNHRWLEDCLRDWELLPEDNYSKSGYEMEMLEAEAKDSEEEAENTTDRQLSHKMVNKSPKLKIESTRHSPLPKSIGEVPKVLCNLSEPENISGVATGRKIRDDPASDFNTDNVSVEPPCLDVGSSSGLSHPQEGTPNIRRGDSVSESLSRCAEKSHSDSRSSAISYKRNSPPKSPLSVFTGEPGNVGSSPKMQLGRPSSVTPGKDDVSPGKNEYVKEINGSGHAEHLQGSDVLHKEASSSKKQKLDISCSKIKQQDISPDVRATVKGSPSLCCKVQESDSVSLVDSTPNVKCHTVSPCDAKKSQGDISIPTSLASEVIPAVEGPLVLENSTPKALYDGSLNQTPQTFSRGSRKSCFVRNPEDVDFEVEKSEHVVVEAKNQLHQVESPSNRNKEVEKSQTTANVEELQQADGNLLTKPARKKTIAKRTWGPRPTLKKAVKQKGSIYSNKALAQNDPQIDLSTETAANEKPNNKNESEPFSVAVNATGVMKVETESSKSSKADVGSAANFIDDETEPPEEKDEGVDVHNEDHSEVADLLHKSDNMIDIDPEGVQHSGKHISSAKNDSLKEEGSIQLRQKDEPTWRQKGRNIKLCNGKQKTLFEEAESESVFDAVSMDKKSKGKPVKKQTTKPESSKHAKSKLGSRKNIESFMEVDKENKPIVDGDEITCQAKDHAGIGVASCAASPEVQKKSRKISSNCLPLTEDRILMKVEPACFILSGHRLQRKDFQQVIRRLKGKFCRDSHQWSYQATHFIAPDPIRRTEKFFAAAASGRWILKTDYLSACSEAGRFLDEKPYEWHKNGLSEDGAINLEAPRKWRLLQQKTGHGAFYGMRIIIYGECIAPPLDTLKRVVKAGDGTILATSPPYNRLLKSGVDFAVVSPGMAREDMWVQEFLEHEIPCVVADYLVEYVCKPGYSRERHILYNTRAWAEKSLANLSSNAQEIVENAASDDHRDKKRKKGSSVKNK